MRRPTSAVLACAVATVALACNPKPPDEADYVAQLAANRAGKDAEFLRAPEPVPASRKAELLPLEYYPIDPVYNVPGALKPSSDSPTMMMPTSSGQQREMRRVGVLEFTLKGRPLKLTAFVEAAAPNMNRLFVPFSDLTSGKETYPAGRYLDLDRTATSLYEVDFNLAYNPFCYFSPMYECPFPPRENRLDIAVEAGERIKMGQAKP